MEEQRNYQRIPFQTEAVISIGETVQQSELVDLALQGALFKSSENLNLSIGGQCQITIDLPSSDLSLEFTGELIHQRGHFYGFLFVSEDAVTMGHLRRLLELNLGNGDEVDKEFYHWLKQD